MQYSENLIIELHAAQHKIADGVATPRPLEAPHREFTGIAPDHFCTL